MTVGQLYSVASTSKMMKDPFPDLASDSESREEVILYPNDNSTAPNGGTTSEAIPASSSNLGVVLWTSNRIVIGILRVILISLILLVGPRRTWRSYSLKSKPRPSLRPAKRNCPSTFHCNGSTPAPVIPSSLADTPCATLGTQGVLNKLNVTLRTSYTLDTPSLCPILED
ncbi:uncharacterized protein ARMOST_14180 [Armillaria ostoyae]|uniref:Uncharacterized protein n=1 Tax=Armillaria ostoyae TaxID=47428 RepID=A0A284RPT3_ARMOS|nr:uncharacterized protein ARMOST_14180 [Armillaria ostoyae]